MEDNPPPKDIKGLAERLIPHTLVDLESFNNQALKMSEFSTGFENLFHTIPLE